MFITTTFEVGENGEKNCCTEQNFKKNPKKVKKSVKIEVLRLFLPEMHRACTFRAHHICTEHHTKQHINGDFFLPNTTGQRPTVMKFRNLRPARAKYNDILSPQIFYIQIII